MLNQYKKKESKKIHKTNQYGTEGSTLKNKCFQKEEYK